MSFKVLDEVCIGCGACDFTCPTGALTKTDSFLGLFRIDALTCDDCGRCVPKCPVDAIVVDDEWAICHGHGCPLSSKRLGAFECTVWAQRCPTCGSTLWQAPDTEVWACPTDDLHLRVRCPRQTTLRKMAALAELATLATRDHEGSDHEGPVLV